MQGVIHNLAAQPRDRWTRCAFPKRAVERAQLGEEAIFTTTNGRTFRAVRGRTIRDHSTIYRVFAQLEGNERVEGVLSVPLPPGVHHNFVPHPWVVDDPGELIPSVVVRKDGVDYASGPASALVMVDNSPAHQRWFMRSEIVELGMVFEWWAELTHLDPVVECWGKLTWSDRSDPNEAIRVDGVALKTGELYVDSFAKAKGMQQPFAAGRDWFTVCSGPRSFADTTGLDFAGQMLAFVTDPSTLPEDLDLETDTGWISWSIRSLMAAFTGWPVVGSGVEHWDGNLLAAKNEPRFINTQTMLAELDSEWNRFADKMEQGGDYYDRRRFGVGQHPGATGDQEDFGAVKGTYVVVGREPKALHMLAYSVYADCYRPGAGFYEGGQPLDPDAHPDWWVWSDYTHYHPGVSRDRLGKTASSFGFPNLGATGFNGYDDQHRSQNNLCAVLALWDDPLAESLIKMRSIPEQKMMRGRVGATRAVGRLSGAWSQYVLLLDDGVERDRFINRINEKLATVLANSDLNAPGPVKVIAHGGPDPRKQVYYPPGHAQAGELAQFWSVWEHGLYSVGTYNLWKATGHQHALDALKQVCATVVEFALFSEMGSWFLVDDMVWLAGGAALDPSLMTTTSRQLVVDPGIGGVTSWGFCTLLIATEVLDPGPLLDKAKTAVRHFTGGREADDRRTAEWWACVATVAP